MPRSLRFVVMGAFFDIVLALGPDMATILATQLISTDALSRPQGGHQ